MNLSGTQIKDTYGNLITIGTVAGTPTTGTLQNGAGSDITSLTLNGKLSIGATTTFGQLNIKEVGATFELNTTADGVGVLSYDRQNSAYKRINLRGSEFLFSVSDVEKARIDSSGNVKIGGTANRATTEGSAQLVLFNGTAPVGTLTNGVSFYSSSGEANVMDAAGNATLLSPHDKDTNEWIFRSKHTPTGKVLKIDVERMLRFINDHFGLDMIEEFTEA
jgi:hypothetical protein